MLSILQYIPLITYFREIFMVSKYYFPIYYSFLVDNPNLYDIKVEGDPRLTSDSSIFV